MLDQNIINKLSECVRGYKKFVEVHTLEEIEQMYLEHLGKKMNPEIGMVFSKFCRPGVDE